MVHVNLRALLEAGEEGDGPSVTSYKAAAALVVQDPHQLSSLTETAARDSLLISLTEHTYFAKFFQHLYSALPPSKSSQARATAEHVSKMLAELLPDLCQLLRDDFGKLLRILCPGLNVCLQPGQPRGMRNLASVMTGCDNLFEHLAAHPHGSAVISRWASFPGDLALDVNLQVVWIERLSSMAIKCPSSHQISATVEGWGDVLVLRQSLQALEAEKAKKSVAALDDGIQSLLKSFNLPIPGSVRMVQSHIEKLSSRHTLPTLRSIVDSFPCKYCLSSSVSLPSIPNFDEKVQPDPSDLYIDILGKGIGVWKILVAEPVFTKIQTMGSHFSPIAEKLRILASGHWDRKGYTGSKKQREQLKVPLTSTDCGRKCSILWQVSIGIAENLDALQQVILIWDIDDRHTIDKTIEKVIHLQRGYSEEKVQRCNQRQSAPQNVLFPAYFEDNLPQGVCGHQSTGRDVRIADQATIHLANKFYALTEPMMRSVLANDLAAEFPFDLSREEAACIAHFQTSSLIMGRSGTGKTTCLIFKMVGKNLTSKAVPDTRPIQQILLTRSSFLADKIKAYVRRLLKTLGSRPDKTFVELFEGSVAQEELESDSVLTLSGDSFPHVCTFDRFLRLLENTATALDRQDFRDVDQVSEQTTNHRHNQPELVDFRAFRLRYWPKFPPLVVKGIPIELVFAEIMGVIKGSESSRKTLDPLSREEYISRSSRLAPSFANHEDRSRVYDIFNAYESMKWGYRDYDAVDRVVKLLRLIRSNAPLLRTLQAKFDEVYIDEVQDLRCLDFELLMSIVRDGRGFHFAGDTAQAISLDSTFRFEDVKKMMFDHFGPANKALNLHQSQLGSTKMFTLAKNYRSHQGILALASFVMDLIWSGFPATIDKLAPEIGDLSGPKPLIVLGCAIDILRSGSVGANAKERKVDFGAEQVIIVRDDGSKLALQSSIGDTALVLTVAESKGMEFDDVILWDFFSGCLDQAGLRSLVGLKYDRTKFDPRERSGMCPVLKNLYVAVTRARNQLFIIETSADTGDTVQKLLTEDSSGSFTLTETTHPGLSDFNIRTEMMRPSTSMEPAGWAKRAEDLMERRFYKDALLSFRRAGDRQGEAIALGHVKEEEGIELADDDDDGPIVLFEAASDQFMAANCPGDAIRVLKRAGKPSKAAVILEASGRLHEAASLFLDAGLSADAVRCYHAASMHEMAVKTLRGKGQYDEMVSYLRDNNDSIAAQTLRSCSLMCKILLKKDRISAGLRKVAIGLLGSFEEQERCIIQYEMDEDLVRLYIDHGRWMDLYRVFFRKGQTDKALQALITKDLLPAAEGDALLLLDYSWAGHLIGGTHQAIGARLRSWAGQLTPIMAARIKQWEETARVCVSKGAIDGHGLAQMEDVSAKWFVIIRKIFVNKAIDQLSVLDTLPLEAAHEAIRFAKDLTLRNDRLTIATLLLLTGVWAPHDAHAKPILLPWSPLLSIVAASEEVDISKIAKNFVLDHFTRAVFALEAKSNLLWIAKWPAQCVYFLTKGYCQDMASGRCKKSHKKVGQDDCAEMLQNLLDINSFLCKLAVFYHQRALNANFLGGYLSMRRRWLERLLSELTFLSAATQHTTTIRSTQLGLVARPEILCSLQDLMYHRLGREWTDRNNFTSLLEQMQLAEWFGPTVQRRFFRALSHKLLHTSRNLLQHHLSLLHIIVSNAGSYPISVFHDTLSTFLHNLENIDVSALSSFHALTSVFEAVAGFLILKTCSVACLLKQSWVDLLLTRYNYNAIATPMKDSADFEQTRVYQQCLIAVANAFCHLLYRMEQAQTQRIELKCSGRTHHPLLLMPRNAELLSVIMSNLAAAPVLPYGFGGACVAMNRAFDLNIVRTPQLKGRNVAELGQRLACAVQVYNGKDHLLVVVKDRTKGLTFTELENQPGVRSVALDQLFPAPVVPAAASISMNAPPSAPMTSQETDYSNSEVAAIIKIQKFWRFYHPRLTKNRQHMLLPESRVVTSFVKLCAHLPPKIPSQDRNAIRAQLFSRGVQLSLKIQKLRAAVSGLQRDAMDCVEKVEVEHGMDDLVDKILMGNRDVEDMVNQAEDRMSEESLTMLVSGGLSVGVEVCMNQVALMVENAGVLVTAARKSVDILAKASS